MIHPRKDYNIRIQDEAGIIPANEPVFLLRAQDEYAPDIVKEYADRLYADGTPIELTDTIYLHVDAMKKWQNEVRCKTPDMPKDTSIYF